MEPFLINALFGGIGVALSGGPLGCFVAWQRLAYFGETIAHAALLGVVLSLLLVVDVYVGIVAVSLLIALVLWRLQRGALASDTLLGVLLHGSLALGLVLVSLTRTIQVDVMGYLFGDVLAMTEQDVLLIFGVAGIVLALLAWRWRELMMMVLSPDIAQVEGVQVEKLRLMLTLLIALTVAVSIKVVGMLLITAMLIIPAASARYFSRTPVAMVCLSMVTGIMSVAGGLWASLTWDTPSGPSIILAAIAVFTVSATSSALLVRGQKAASSHARG